MQVHCGANTTTPLPLSTFLLCHDTRSRPFFSVPIPASSARNISLMGYFNVNTFLRPVLPVTPLASNPFSTDLTSSSDDILISFLSLPLLFTIDALIASLLLRTDRHNRCTTFGFSVKQAVELARDFQFHAIIASPRTVRPLKLNLRLLLVAFLVFFSSFLLETAILFLTSQRITPIRNSTATIRVMQPVLPKWDKVSHHYRASWNRPCRSGRLLLVQQRDTRINVCITSNIDGLTPVMFEPIATGVTLEMTSRLHRYGADHEIRVGNLTRVYRTRAFFALGDGRERVMAAEEAVEGEEGIVGVLHKLVVAYVFSAYVRETRDGRVTLGLLNGLGVRFGRLGDSEVSVLDGLAAREVARMYRTVVVGEFPVCTAAFHAARNVFGGAAALVVREGDVSDFVVQEGRVVEAEAVVWGEVTRVLNWLSVCIVLAVAMAVLGGLRMWLRPANTADIAGLFVKREVGASLDRSPVEVGVEEETWFRVWRDEAVVEGRGRWGGKENEIYDGFIGSQQRWSGYSFGAVGYGAAGLTAVRGEYEDSGDDDECSESAASSQCRGFGSGRCW